MNPHPRFFKMRNDQRVRVCHFCKKQFVRSEDKKGWRDHCKHVAACARRHGAL